MDNTVPQTALRTATNAPAKMTGGKRSTYTLRNGSSVSVKYDEANVCFPIVSVAEATVQGNWFVFGPGGQAMVSPEASAELERIVSSPGAVQLQKRRGVYWLPCTTTGKQDGEQVPLCAVRRAAAAQEAPLAAEGSAAQAAAQGSAAPAAAQESGETPASSSTDPVRLDESEEARKPNTKKLPPQATPEEIDRHNVTHLPLRSWRQHCVRGKAADDNHERLPPTGVPGDAKWAMDYFF